MASLEGDFEEQLKEAGERLLNRLPSDVDELLPLLDLVENCLSRVEQSPSKSMQNALCSSMKALVADDLLRHSDMDVKVAVASCISEITRITAPEAPYDDDQMKEIFQLIVGAFEKLFDTSSRSYSKRVSILETVAKVRSCVVMLDLECDALILDMFHHFLKAIRDDHPENVFSAMETIMTLVLEESEDISSELLSPILNSVKKENQDVLPIAQKLGKKVIGNCAAKLKPYMIQAVESLGVSFSDYCDIVASICQETSDAAERNEANVSGECLAGGSKSSDKTGADEPQVASEVPPETTGTGSVDPAVDKSPKSVMSNGNAQIGNDDSLVDQTSPKKKPERSRRTNQSKSIDEAAKTEPDISESEKLVKPEAKPEQATKKTRGRKPNSLMKSTEGSDRSRIDREKESVEEPDRRKSRTKEADSATSEGPSTKEMALSSEPEKESQAQASSPTASPSEAVNVVSSSAQTHSGGTHSKKGRRGPKKKGSRNNEAEPGSPPKVATLSDHGKDEAAPPSAAVSSKKESEGTSDSEAKPHQSRGKKALAGKAIEKTPTPVHVASKKESGVTSDSDVKSLRKSGKKLDGKNANEDESSGKQQEGKKRGGRGKTVSDKDVVEESSKKATASSPKSATKQSNKDDSHVENTPKISSKRKRTPGKEDASETLQDAIEYGANLVGSNIKVYWPKDRMSYTGIVSAYDPVKKKHKVSYYDGDVEVLNLRREKWQFDKDNDMTDGGQETDLPSPGASSDMHQKKKAKMNSDSSPKQGKTDASAKRSGGVSTSKPKSEATKSGGKSKDDVKLSGKSKDDSSKGVNKSKVETPKTSSKAKDGRKSGSKLKDDTSKMKSKDETTKTSTKSKGETPKTGGKTSANGTTAKGKSSSLKIQENEDSVKGKSDSAKAQESETKSGKKRGRKVNG